MIDDVEIIEIEKAKVQTLVEIIDYIPNSLVIKTITKKITGYIRVISFDKGEVLVEKTIPFDNFVQIIDGKAEIIIDEISNLLEAGQSIIIPAHASNVLKARERLKMLSTIIKSGYE
jgi:quercetin dioxygenase-like cupin family protein